MNAYLLGVFESDANDGLSYELTYVTKKINKNLEDKIESSLKTIGSLKLAKTRIFYSLLKEYPVICLVGLGKVKACFNELNNIDEAKENIRKAIGAGVIAIRDLDLNIKRIDIDDCSNPQAAAEGAHLALYSFDELKKNSLKKPKIDVTNLTISAESYLWEKGSILAYYQNKCRYLMEMPANILTPTKFGEFAKEIAEPLGAKVIVHDKAWAESMKMGSFLSVANGSDQPPKFVEIHYSSPDNNKKPVVLVGKGITFDSGGISLKAGLNMDIWRGDLGGASNVLCTIAALAKLKANVNIIGLIPLTENMPSGKATKPGDVVRAMNGKSIQIDNTDAEGRLILADALCYADQFKPELIVDIATLTVAIKLALGAACSAVYSTNSNYWKLIRDAGFETGDRVWRMPLFEDYKEKTTNSVLADVINISKSPSYGAGSPIAAAFLKEFVETKNWMHIDMAGVMDNSGEITYMSKGMSGRPMRTLVNFIEKLFS